MPTQLQKNRQNIAQNKPRNRNGPFGLLRMIVLLIIIIGIALSLGLIQSAMISKQAFFERLESYINFANPNYRFVYIYPGMRREEIVDKYAKVLAWNEKDKRWFTAAAPADPENGGYMEGYYLAKTYFVDKDATGLEVGEMMHQEFLTEVSENVLASKDDKGNSRKIKNFITGEERTISLDEAITIASIIQREAAGKHDMNLISGVIWNRIFRGMSLDMDATLQYAKGSEDNWWPQLSGRDKYIESPYNTYQNKGLPPGAISNPSIDAINAAYNPKKTDCIFYLHDNNRRIHCTKTYEEHKKNIDRYLR